MTKKGGKVREEGKNKVHINVCRQKERKGPSYIIHFVGLIINTILHSFLISIHQESIDHHQNIIFPSTYIFIQIEKYFLKTKNRKIR